MANFEQTARSNYFPVRNMAEFIKWVGRFRYLIVERQDDDTVALFAEDGWPNLHDDDDSDSEFAKELQKQLPDGAVAVLVACGHEKMRYVDAHAAIVVGGRGEVEYLDFSRWVMEHAQKYSSIPISIPAE